MLRELLIQMGYVTNSKLLKQNKRAWLLPRQLSQRNCHITYVECRPCINATVFSCYKLLNNLQFNLINGNYSF